MADLSLAILFLKVAILDVWQASVHQMERPTRRYWSNAVPTSLAAASAVAGLIAYTFPAVVPAEGCIGRAGPPPSSKALNSTFLTCRCTHAQGSTAEHIVQLYKHERLTKVLFKVLHGSLGLEGAVSGQPAAPPTLQSAQRRPPALCSAPPGQRRQRPILCGLSSQTGSWSWGWPTTSCLNPTRCVARLLLLTATDLSIVCLYGTVPGAFTSTPFQKSKAAESCCQRFHWRHI